MNPLNIKIDGIELLSKVDSGIIIHKPSATALCKFEVVFTNQFLLEKIDLPNEVF